MNRGSSVSRALGLSESDGEGDGQEENLIRVIFGSMFAYVLLCAWVWTIAALITFSRLLGCSAAGIVEDPSEETADTLQECNDFFAGSLSSAHSIIFGLLSAVVVHETDSSDETATLRLSSIVKPLLNTRRLKDANCLQRALFGMIVSLPAVYVVSWTVLGLFCFVFSLSSSGPTDGPLFYTGFTWLGLSIKVAYSFFGVGNSATSAKDDSPDETRRENQVDAEERLEPYPSLFDAHS